MPISERELRAHYGRLNFKSAGATRLARPEPQPVITDLDRAWEQINALGGTFDEGDEYGRGVSETVGVVLDIIEKLGGGDPALKRR